jgi:hypothetical protein
MDASLREVNEEMRAKLDAHHGMMARKDSQSKKMVACLENTEAMDLEANPEEKVSESDRQEVPKEEAAVKTIRALMKWYGDQHLAVGHH